MRKRKTRKKRAHREETEGEVWFGGIGRNRSGLLRGESKLMIEMMMISMGGIWVDVYSKNERVQDQQGERRTSSASSFFLRAMPHERQYEPKLS
jgi:hypothetical protein